MKLRVASNDKKYFHGCTYSMSITINPSRAKFIKWSNTLKQIVGKLRTICLSVFAQFLGSALKGLISIYYLFNVNSRPINVLNKL